MTPEPWMGDACSLVDAFRAGTISPTEALEGSLAAIADSKLNAVCFVDEEPAREAAAAADVELPFGGVPIGVKELDPVKGWPQTEASLVFKDRIADYDATTTARLRQAGAVLVAQTTASEFGGINCTYTRLHGATSNPYDLERTPGGSSGGSAASVSGGLLPLCTGGDGGGSIRIPAGFTGLFGLKATFGRIPKGPHTEIEPLTAVMGCVSRSVRDTARWFDACNGADEYDPFSLPRVEGWEAGLGQQDIRGKRVAVSVDLGAAIVASARAGEGGRGGRPADQGRRPRAGRRADRAAPGRAGVGPRRNGQPARRSGRPLPRLRVGAHARDHAGGQHRHQPLQPGHGQEHRGVPPPDHCADGARSSSRSTSSSAPPTRTWRSPPRGRCRRPSTAWTWSSEYGFEAAVGNNGALTIPANTTGHPAVAIPIGLVDGLPVSMQIIGRRHAEQLLLDLAHVVERERPWPLVAPGAPI